MNTCIENSIFDTVFLSQRINLSEGIAGFYIYIHLDIIKL